MKEAKKIIQNGSGCFVLTAVHYHVDIKDGVGMWLARVHLFFIFCCFTV
jgi:hypothetical protein